MIVADTSILIDHLRGRSKARALLHRARADGETLTASVLTRVEVLAGVRSGEEEGTAALLGELVWIAVDEEVADVAGSFADRFGRSHAAIDVVDYVVAATVQQRGATLWTTNVRHFPMFPELEPPY